MNPGTWGLVKKLDTYKEINKKQAALIRELRESLESRECEGCNHLQDENDDLVNELLETRRQRDAFKYSLTCYIKDDGQLIGEIE